MRVLKEGYPYPGVDGYLAERGVKRILLVGGNSARKLPVWEYFYNLKERMGIETVPFGDFSPNPKYESVLAGTKLYREAGCDMVAAVGGGSAIDVAKCIKMFVTMDPTIDYLEQKIEANEVPFLVMPTTAGTGSEATRFAVIYVRGNKYSVTDESCLPELVLLDSSVLLTLPLYQKKATMLDVFGHAMESFWAVESTPESRALAAEAIRGAREHLEGYLANEPAGNEGMLLAAHLAGKAINQTRTTAGHAMCYKLTSLYGLAHGHAVALCNRGLFRFLVRHTEECIDPRGEAYLKEMLTELAGLFGCETPEEAAEAYSDLLDQLGMEVPAAKEEEYPILTGSVNPARMKNFPVRLDEKIIEQVYREILQG